jgi:large subunit ribosomal protein L4
MFKAPVLTAEGKHGDQELPAELFDGTVHQAAMWQVVKAYLANQRQANASTKGRSEVQGGNKKPWRQKGTGRARQGSIRAAQWRGGGSVFGPRGNRNYHQDVPKQVRWLARRSAYNVRAQDNSVYVVEGLSFEPKTRNVVGLLAHIDVLPDSSRNVLVLTDGHRADVHLAARNLTNVQVRQFGQESAYDLLWADSLIIERPALERAAEVAHA